MSFNHEFIENGHTNWFRVVVGVTIRLSSDKWEWQGCWQAGHFCCCCFLRLCARLVLVIRCMLWNTNQLYLREDSKGMRTNRADYFAEWNLVQNVRGERNKRRETFECGWNNNMKNKNMVRSRSIMCSDTTRCCRICSQNKNDSQRMHRHRHDARPKPAKKKKRNWNSREQTTKNIA